MSFCTLRFLPVLCRILWNSSVFVLAYQKQFVKIDVASLHFRYSSWSRALNFPKKMFYLLPLKMIKKYASRELSYFKNSFCKEKCSTKLKNKITLLHETILLRKFKKEELFLDVWYQQRCNVITEMTDIKWGLLSKLLFQRAQQHVGCTKPQGNDRFL